MQSDRFAHPDQDGFFPWDSGDVWVFDGDRYVLRAYNGKEILATAVVEDSASFWLADDPATAVDDLPEFGDYRFGIKPARPTDRITVLVRLTGETMAADLAALDAAFA